VGGKSSDEGRLFRLRSVGHRAETRTQGVVGRGYSCRRTPGKAFESYRKEMSQGQSLSRERFAADVALAVALTLFILGATSRIPPDAGDKSLDWLAYACIVVAGGSLAFRRRGPLAVVTAVTGALLVYTASDYVGGSVPPWTGFYVTAPVALYSLATQRPRRLAFAMAALLALSLLFVAVAAGRWEWLTYSLFVGWSAAAVFLGDAVRSRREHLAGLVERARHLEETREEEARRRVAEERLRIARDLHDSVAHSMATINVQSGVASHVIDRRPDQARAAIEVVRETSEEVLEELGALVSLLRVDRNEPAPLTPTPGLERIPELIESSRHAGADVSLRVEGSPRPVPVPMAVAAYRIVQESLTNVIRYADPAVAEVTLGYGGDGRFWVEVVDEGREKSEESPGARVGLVGMRERAEATGGTLEVGRRPQGGFCVRAQWTGGR
jgi:signal transduction histidine kinase